MSYVVLHRHTRVVVSEWQTVEEAFSDKERLDDECGYGATSDLVVERVEAANSQPRGDE